MKFSIHILFFFASVGLIAQKTENKTIISTSKTLIIELESIDSLELKTTKKAAIFEVTSRDVTIENTPKVYEENGVVYIKALIDSNKLTGSDKNKYRAGQPLYPKYIIQLPANINTTVIYTKGNFTANNFIGNLDLHIKNYGLVEINQFKGSVSVESFLGKINCTIIDAAIDIETSKSDIESSLLDDKLKQTKTSLKGIYKNDGNSLKIKTINAKVNLKPVLTQK